MSNGSEVYAYLVCAPGFWHGFDERGITEGFEHSIGGFGGTDGSFHAAPGECGALAIAAG